jgi:hypothetical protein
MSKAASVKVFPLVTTCEADNCPVADNIVAPAFIIAQCVAVPFAVTAPSVMAGTTVLRPVGVLSVAAPSAIVALFPSDAVTAAAAVAGSDEQMCNLVPFVIK